MTKLVVEVLDASDLMHKDGQGSASPFVEVEFDEQRQRTQTKPKDLNPAWNEKLVFDVNNSLRDLPSKTIDVVVYNDQKAGNHRNFLGRVKIYGVSVPLSESEASIQRYPLDKRGLFSHIKGDIGLKIYLLDHDGGSDYNHASPQQQQQPPPPHEEETPLQEINTNNRFGHEDHEHVPDDYSDHEEKIKKKNKKKEKEVRTFHSIGTAAPPPMKEKVSETRADFAKAVTPAVMQMQMQVPKQNPEFLLVETFPPLAARLRYRGGSKITSTYDLVEQMHYLYVSVVKARDLPVMDVTGSLDPYVEVKLGNYIGRTKQFEKNQNPVWHQTFAFAKERLQANLVEVIVKDKDFGLDDFVGKVVFEVTDLPVRVPPDSPLAPQWYGLQDKHGVKHKQGEVMLAVWIGTQADESFPDAWHSDAHEISHSNLANTRSKVYFSPKLYYLRAHVIEAQDLVPHDKGRAPEAYVKIILGNQGRTTRPVRGINPVWNDEMMFVASEPFEDFIIVSVEDRVGPGKDETLGRVIVSVRDVPQRLETNTHGLGMNKLPDPRWLNLHRPSLVHEEGIEKKKEKFSSKVQIRFVLEAGYHVLDESTHFSSNLQPSSKHLRKGNVGILELGILGAKNLHPMKSKDGRTTDAYCVAKYGNKWIRTRTILDTLHPRWNEQYSWEVYDPCTVITIGVFDNHHISGSSDARDQRIGKVRIRLSTLETERVYTHYYPLLVLTPSGLKNQGELELALRFTCTAWSNMLVQYGKPLLPKMHYVNPIPFRFIESLRYQAMQIVAARLTRAEPPLRREVVEYMLDVDMNMFSLRKSKANFFRIMNLLSGVTVICRWFNDICLWRNPVTTILVHVLFLILVCYPELILPTIFLYLFVIGIWNYRFRPRHPPHMDARVSQADHTHPDELDEEFDTFPTSKHTDMVRMRYDRIRSVAGRVQTVAGDLASQGERAQALLSWRDPRATSIFIILSLIFAVCLYVTPFQVVAVLIGLYLLRHPRFRSRTPSVPVNFFKRLPARSDMLL
ncbi:C2 calcium/lipid-binding plant phosphoribosyltransferase family protein [Tripterygium wilfordii]|uniref:C2 calcium/lipid-binding plant phosphoribosyltransferase family protein n=1 Tax=Tripterygium wilfordii TaxID=458696 RepID=A0A7J7CBP7_TRIWF|nr:FT-interacting protein 7-like [Tripterygium wilfordii]KAF5731558.1 C2 calcium/lipid-binding plant phosphoribosyltransferase family protein [Tripterygium wilfordii]